MSCSWHLSTYFADLRCLHLARSGGSGEHQWMMRNPLTQSCFLCRRGLIQDTKLVVGLPMLSSPGNLRFWITLCGCSAQDSDLAALVAAFEGAAAAGKPQLRDFCREWNARLLRKVLLHVLPCGCCTTLFVAATAVYRMFPSQVVQA